MDDQTISTSVLALALPDCLKKILLEHSHSKQNERKSLLLSSNSLANRFILEQWGIRPSQRKRYRNLFMIIRRHCRLLFEFYLKRGRFYWEDSNGTTHLWGLYEFDRIRGNIIIAFVNISKNDPFLKH